MQLYDRLKEMRQDKDLTQTEIANMLKINPSARAGRTSTIGFAFCRKIEISTYLQDLLIVVAHKQILPKSPQKGEHM